jgi:hypothetical protein
MVADRALMKFSENATFLRSVNRDYDKSFEDKEAKIGDTLRVPIPQHTIVRKGRVANITPLQTILRPVTVFGQRGFDVQFSSSELALDIEEFEKRYLSQQVADLVISIESEVLGMAISATPNQTGPLTVEYTTPANILFYQNNAKKLIEDNGGFKGTKQMLVNAGANLKIVPGLSGLFNAQKQLDTQYEEGYLGRAAGFDWNTSTVMPSQLRGAGAGYVLNGSPAAGATSIVVGTGTGAINKGEIFTIVGINAVHPQTKANLGYLRQFVVTSDYAGGAGTLSFYPALTPSGSEQNISAMPVTTNAITLSGTASTNYNISMAYTKDAFTFGTVDLPEYPDRPCSRRVFESISMRVAQGSDIVNDIIMMRFDIMCAFGALRPEWACRLGDTGSLTAPA